jgi:translation initiation factor 2B subunit (eIF-2B alpha/beta/delta family)
MIDIKSNIDHLDGLAAQFMADDFNDNRLALIETGKDIRAAAADLKNLRDYAVQLERHTERMIADIQTLKDSAGISLVNELERFIDRRIAAKLDDINPNEEDIRQQVRSMIQDGEIVVTVDHSSIDLELSLEV